MSRLHTSFVLGYHGCDGDSGRAIVRGEAAPIPSNSDYDWLGPGLYFWQSDPVRALEWARERTGPRAYKEPYVIGAVIDLGNCLDLTERENIAILPVIYESFKSLLDEAGEPLPANERATYDAPGDYSKRFLDNAVMKHLHEYMERERREKNPPPPPFDTILGVFVEGGSVYPGSVFKRKTHCQIAVVNQACIRGYFIPQPYPS